jgi:hypothetical protein
LLPSGRCLSTWVRGVAHRQGPRHPVGRLLCVSLSLIGLTIPAAARAQEAHERDLNRLNGLVLGAAGFVSGRRIEPLGTANATSYYAIIHNGGRDYQRGRMSLALPRGLVLVSLQQARLRGRLITYTRRQCERPELRHVVCRLRPLSSRATAEVQVRLRATRRARYGDKAQATIRLLQGGHLRGERHAHVYFSGTARLHARIFARKRVRVQARRRARMRVEVSNKGPRPACGATISLYMSGGRGSIRIVHFRSSRGRVDQYSDTDVSWTVKCLAPGRSINAHVAIRPRQRNVNGYLHLRALSLAGNPPCTWHPSRCPARSTVKIQVPR